MPFRRVSLFKSLKLSSSNPSKQNGDGQQAEKELFFQTIRKVVREQTEADIVQDLAEMLSQLSYAGGVLSVEGRNFILEVVTDPQTETISSRRQQIIMPSEQVIHMLEENSVTLLGNINQPSRYDNLISFLLPMGYRSAALVSIQENKHLSKVLVLAAREVEEMSRADQQSFVNLAEVIGASLEKLHNSKTLQLRLNELQTLSAFSQAISAEVNLDHLYAVLHQQVIQMLDSDLPFAVAIYNAANNQIEFPYFYENGQAVAIPPSSLGRGLTSIVLQSRQPLLLSTEKEIRARSPILAGDPAKSWLGIPLLFGGEILGAILVQDLVNENRFSEAELHLLQTLAPQIATAVRNTQLYTETQQALQAYAAEHDLLNTLLDNIPEEIAFKDPQGRYSRVSASFAARYTQPAENIVGKTDFDLTDQLTADTNTQDDQQVLVQNRPELGRIQMQTPPNGNERWSQISRIPIYATTGDPSALLIIQQDISEIKQAEALAQRRAAQVLTAAEIARDSTGTLDVSLLLQKSIQLIRERFGYYHASIFLLDSAGEYAVLRESTGEAGKQLLAAGHRLAVRSKSIVGRATASGEAVIVNDVSADSTHLPNPMLRDTRSEMALPLSVGKRVIGVLDVQSTAENAFHAEDVSILGILADQLAVAIINGNLFAETQALLGKHRLLRQVLLEASASSNIEDALSFIVSGLLKAKVGDRVAILALSENNTLKVAASEGYANPSDLLGLEIALGQGISGKAALEKRPIRVGTVLDDARYLSGDPQVRAELAIPILFGDELLGVLNLESTHPFAFDENDEEIFGALGNNLGSVIANIRLIEQIRTQVARERQLFEITSRIRQSVDLKTVLETSTQEIARALGARRASIRITAGNSRDDPHNGGLEVRE